MLRDIYTRLDAAYGAETWHWEPDYVRSPMDVIVGAILVQHTTWVNAERAVDKLRDAAELDPASLLALPDDQLIDLIRVSGTPTVKAKRLRALATTIIDAGGLDIFLGLPLSEMRPRLLATHGVGPETADAIALYAAGHRTFVIDAYTRRIFTRIGATPQRDGYDDWRTFFERSLPHADTTLFQRYHAWIVLHGKAICRPQPKCGECPLVDLCAEGRHKDGTTMSADYGSGGSRIVLPGMSSAASTSQPMRLAMACTYAAMSSSGPMVASAIPKRESPSSTTYSRNATLGVGSTVGRGVAVTPGVFDPAVSVPFD